MAHDLGATFGGAGNLSRGAVAKLNLEEWSSKPIFKDPAQCIGELNASVLGDLQHPRIREAGREFLAKRLALLTDRQIRDLFTAARVEKKGDTIEKDGARRPVSVDDWVQTFKRKRAEVANHRCPD
jgi:hypothetical protein